MVQGKQSNLAQFRFSGQLGRILMEFTQSHGLTASEIGRNLVGLAAADLDMRFYFLVQMMTLGNAWEKHSFWDCCEHLRNALEVFSELRESPSEDERTHFIFDTAWKYLTNRNVTSNQVEIPHGMPCKGHQEMRQRFLDRVREKFGTNLDAKDESPPSSIN